MGEAAVAAAAALSVNASQGKEKEGMII